MDKNFDMSVFPRFFCFIAFSGVSQRWEFKNTKKKTFYKKIVSKSLYKKNDKKSKTVFFFLGFVLSRFWAFLGEEFKNTTKKISGKKLALVLFWPLALTYLPFNFFWRPLAADAAGRGRFQISNPISSFCFHACRLGFQRHHVGAAGFISQGPPRSSHFSASQQPASRSHSPQPPPPPPTHTHTCALELFTHRNLVAARLLL
jgi:hypothetical protein